MGLQNLNLEQVKSFQVSLPPLNEQRRIADKIDALQAKSRRAREALEAVGPLLEKFRQSVLAAAFRGDLTAEWRKQHPDVEPAEKLLERIRAERRALWEEAELAKMRAKGIKPKDNKWKAKYTEPEPVDVTGLPELPEGWCWTSAEECSWEITVGHVGSMKNEYRENGIPFLRSQNVRRNRFEPANLEYISSEFHQSLAKSTLNPGDLVVVRSGEPGTACVIPEWFGEANCSDLVICRLLPGTDANLLSHYVNSPTAKAFVQSKQVGVAQQHFNVGAMKSLPVPIIPRSEQGELLRALDRLDNVVEGFNKRGISTQVDLNRLDQSILAKAFRGEFVPQDPNDEPASVLLERIKAEREAATDKKRTRKKTE